MQTAFRVVVVVMVVLTTYFFVYWLPFSLIPLGEQYWIASLLSLACAIAAGRYAWVRTQSAPGGLISSVSYGAMMLGGIGFCAGFFGPIIFSPQSNQGPLLGIFITGPLGFLFGGVGGYFHWRLRRTPS